MCLRFCASYRKDQRPEAKFSAFSDFFLEQKLDVVDTSLNVEKMDESDESKSKAFSAFSQNADIVLV